MSEIATKDISKFITFYSYKGGVGRTSALVNSAILRANAGNKVIVIDFDLEAPGTGSYLRQLDSDYGSSKPGILEYLIEAIESPEVPSIKEYATDFSSKLDRSNGGELWVIGAGDVSSPNYHKNLEKIKWSEIFELSHGEALLENLKGQIQNEFKNPDFVFIDARTGITETGGVCTRYLADAVVILTSLNDQNIMGTSSIFNDLKNDKKRKKKFILVASNIPVGLPFGADQQFYERLQSFNKVFGKSPDVCIYNYPSLSLSELLPIVRPLDKKTDRLFNSIYETDPLVNAYKKLSRLVGSLHKNSFLNLIRKASMQVAFGAGKEYIDKLKKRYSDRLLAKIVIEIDLFYTQNKDKKVSEIDRDKFIEVSDWQKVVTNSDIERAIDLLKQKFWSQIDDELADSRTPMRKEWEIFFGIDHLLFRQALKEMNKGFYDWPIEYFQEALRSGDENDQYDMAANLFNLAQCYRLTGKKSDKEYYGKFKEVLEKYGLDRVEGNYNVYFCYGMACTFLGKLELGKKILLEVIDQVQDSSDTEFFSPIVYDEVSKDKFIMQIRDFMLENF